MSGRPTFFNSKKSTTIPGENTNQDNMPTQVEPKEVISNIYPS